jgi:hypothetical protein
MCSSCWQLMRQPRAQQAQQQQQQVLPAAVRAPKQPQQRQLVVVGQQLIQRARGVHLGLGRSTSLTV